jgi:hypothetical protein
MNAGETLGRWHAFLEKVHARVHAILEEAARDCATLFEAERHDPRAMSNAWTSQERRAQDLVTKIRDTWSGSVEDALSFDVALRAAEQERGDAMVDGLGLAIEACKRRIWADAARVLWQRATHEGPTSDAWRMVEHFAVPALCDEGTWQEWLALRAAERGRRGHDGDRFENLRAHEQAQIAHERAWLELRARMLPQHAPALAKDLHGRMAQFYIMLDRERAWIDAGRPRAIV